jgi:hypothetical protein
MNTTSTTTSEKGAPVFTSDGKVVEITGNLWDQEADIICITTNGFVKNNGKAVMGRGVAKEATERVKGIQTMLGTCIKKYGNAVCPITQYNYEKDGEEQTRIICSFPTKHNWWEDSDLELIRRSAEQLALVVEAYQLDSVVVPRPGCGNGNLTWEEVSVILNEVWGGDTRFKVITFDES